MLSVLSHSIQAMGMFPYKICKTDAAARRELQSGNPWSQDNITFFGWRVANLTLKVLQKIESYWD